MRPAGQHQCSPRAPEPKTLSRRAEVPSLRPLAAVWACVKRDYRPANGQGMDPHLLDPPKCLRGSAAKSSSRRSRRSHAESHQTGDRVALWLASASTRQTELGEVWTSRAIARTWRSTRPAVAKIRPTILGSNGGRPSRLLFLRATSSPALVRSLINARSNSATAISTPS